MELNKNRPKLKNSKETDKNGQKQPKKFKENRGNGKFCNKRF